ncbi:MAG: phosphodiester glycosidase family protein [Candidatus Babeliaceae bacterium]|nr:phosphodiester glycosidase family protein [Candidatus Babeliaceae bacterium]
MNRYLFTILTCSSTFANTMILQDTQTYGNITHAIYEASDFPARAHVITMPLDAVSISLVPAIGQREAVSAIAKRAGALVAVNGSNYRRGGNYNGNRVNLLYLNNKVYADLGLTRGTFCWKSENETPIIDTVFLDTQFSINDTPLPVTAINQPRVAGQAILYTDVADTALLAYTPGKNILIDSNHIVTSVSPEIPKIIPDGYLVYQVDAAALPSIKPGMSAVCTFTVSSVESQTSYNDYDFAIGGAGLLLKGGSLLSDNLYKEFSQGTAIVHCGDEVAADFITKEMQEWLIELRHPRTAIGITTHNEICLVVVDGRQEHSEGLSLKELALFMQQLGCIDALNIGGGGCTTLCIDNKLINSPSAGQERPVSEALCFCID